jgi:phosphomevalonate kinase
MALVHNVAQYCHCLAQGKVGSGFDVSSAVWGSQVYRKFGPDALDELMDESAVRLPRSVSDPPTASPADVLSPCVVDQPSRSLLPALQPENSRWTNEVAPFELPPHTRLMLADVDAGSDTPSLVGKVLKWRKESSDVGQSLLDRAARPHRASRLLLVLHSSPSRSQPELEYAIAPQRGPCGPLWHAEDARRAGP